MLSNPNQAPRVALFTDTFFEPNGVATLSRQFSAFAQARDLPLLIVRGSEQTSFTSDGSVQTQQLKRGFASFPLDMDLRCDPFLARHKKLILHRLREFKPDLVHLTGPGDIGLLALWLSHTLQIPLVSSWHTNLHEYLAKRLDRALHLLPETIRHAAAAFIESQSLRVLLRFYKSARFTLAPNQSLVNRLHASTGNPSFLMHHGVDLSGFYPTAHASQTSRPFCIGYVGRLTTEKNVRLLEEIESKLIAAGEHNFKFLIVGEGGQQKWLQNHMHHAELPGVLRGEKLLAAYNRMDAFVFPSHTDTFGLVILEAMASGVPVILAPETGHRIGIEDGVSGFLAQDFTASLQTLMRNPNLRESMSRAARAFANTNGWDHVFEQLYETYVEGIALSNRQRAEKLALV